MLMGYGVPAVFGIPGGQTLPLYDAILSRSPAIRHIPMRDERNAAYAADGYARISGRVGVCDATVGPGAIKLTSGLAEALNASIPILAIVSDMPSDWLAVRYRGGGNQLVDQMSVLAPLNKWTGRLTSPNRLPELVQRAFQTATTGRPGPVTIELPEDVFRAETDPPTRAVDPRFGQVPPDRPAPEASAVRAAAVLLSSAERPVGIVGGGARLSDAGAELKELAEKLALPVATTHSGKGILPEDHPLSLGVLGALGGSPVAKSFVDAADVVLAVGFKFGQNPTFKWSLPRPGQRLIQIDIDPAEIGRVFPVEVGMVADARSGLEALSAARTGQRPMDAVTSAIEAQRHAWKEELARQSAPKTPIRPQHVARLIDELSGPDAILVCDASFASGWGASFFGLTGQRRAIFPRGMGGLGWGLPAAIGAHVARPAAKVVVLAGDGAMTYSLGELATLAQQSMNVTVVVLNNSTLGWIKWEQAAFWDGKFQSTDLSDVDFAAVARGMGCAGDTVREPGDLREALARALSSEGPSVVDVLTDPGEVAVPKFAESPEARGFMRAK